MRHVVSETREVVKRNTDQEIEQEALTDPIHGNKVEGCALPPTIPIREPLEGVRTKGRLHQAIKRPRTRSTAARQVSNAYERDVVKNQNV